MVDPTWSMSRVMYSPDAHDVVFMLVTDPDVLPEMEIVGRLAWVEKIVDPFLFTSAMMDDPVGTVPTEIRTERIVIVRPASL